MNNKQENMKPLTKREREYLAGAVDWFTNHTFDALEMLARYEVTVRELENERDMPQECIVCYTVPDGKVEKNAFGWWILTGENLICVCPMCHHHEVRKPLEQGR